MKLQQLQEARYSGQHPIIKWIYGFMEADYDSPVVHASHQFNSVAQAMDIRDVVIAEFGPPQSTDTDEWNFTEWRIEHDHRIATIEISHGVRGPHVPGFGKQYIEADIEITCRSTSRN